METNNLPKRLSADILKETAIKEHTSFSDDIKLPTSQHIRQNEFNETFHASCFAGTDQKLNTNSKKSGVNVVSAEYGFRASSMRNKIEKKISEIEEKFNVSYADLSMESLEFETCLPDYNTIKVLDAKRSHSCSVSEMRQSTIDRLQSKLEKAEKDLELREEEVARLRKLRDEVGFEIEDLTASLFEEANNMVKNAYQRQQKAEKCSKEAYMKLSMLQEEVGALKSIVQSFKRCSSLQVPDVSENETSISPRESYEVDPVFNKEFVLWRQNPILDKKTPFLKRIYEEDIYPCLDFENSKLSQMLISAIENDKIIIEKIHSTKNEPLPKECALMNAPRLCPYKMYLDEKECYNISALSRNRIASICDLFCYFRYIEKGLISLSKLMLIVVKTLKWFCCW